MGYKDFYNLINGIIYRNIKKLSDYAITKSQGSINLAEFMTVLQDTCDGIIEKCQN